MDEIDVAKPLADALTKVAELSNRSESDPDLMFDLLVEMRDTIEDAFTAFRQNKLAASKAEAAALRAELAAKGK